MQSFNSISGYITFFNKPLGFPMNRHPEWEVLLDSSWEVQRTLSLAKLMVVEVIRTLVFRK
jgi:hypothetical protein